MEPALVTAVNAFPLALRINFTAPVVVADVDTFAAPEKIAVIPPDVAKDELALPAAPLISFIVPVPTTVVGLLAAFSLINTTVDETVNADEILAAKSWNLWPADAMECADKG
jgi:hypothetical protein